MSVVGWNDLPLRCILHQSHFTGRNVHRGSTVCFRWHHLGSRYTYNNKRLCCSSLHHGCGIYRLSAHADQGDSGDTFTETVEEDDGFSSGNTDVLEMTRDELAAARNVLAETRTRQQQIENERDHLIEELARAEAKQQEYIATIKHEKELAISELEAAKNMFNHRLEESIEEKFALESKLVLAKQDAVDLAVQVEKLAELAFQQATSHILEDARMRISAAETSAAEAAYQIEEQIRNATEGTLMSIVEQSKVAITKALEVAEKASEHARKTTAAPQDGTNLFDEFSALQTDNIKLKNSVSNLESELLLARGEIDRLKSELEQAMMQAKTSDLRAAAAERAFFEFQELAQKKSEQMEEETKAFLEKVKKETAKKEKASHKAFKAELEDIMAAVDAVKETARLKDEAYMKRCAALHRSLNASEAASKIWRQRAEMAESLLQSDRLLGEGDEESSYLVNGGRIDLLTDEDSQKWKLLADGPRREIPEWMARRIRSIFPKFPPKKLDVSEAFSVNSVALELPKPDEVWSIAQEKPKEGDTLVEHVIEREIIEKKRKSLERVLQRRTIQWQRTPEQTKLEPGTGTGREIVFQGFNWESWRRRWYTELTPKAADLSKSGITAVWFPPPTESVAPQGYMPSDLYNLNSAYGSEDELKHCIEEMHAQDLLALGDVVLNHRCAQKQSPSGVWNIFGGKLDWGPEAIVCDDPNFQGRGNPSSGDIFHAAPNIDHSQEFVRKDIKQWLNWLRNDIGFDGWRLDFVRGFAGGYVKEYIEASIPAFAIGEYWDSLAYEGGNLSYNQDAHRQRIVNWINATGGTSSAFDVTTKGILHSALHNQYWRLIDPQGKPTGVMGWWPSRAVTFLENHDTGSTQGHWPFPRDKLEQGYAYILTHPGTPVVFYDHFYDFGLHDTITELIEARRRAGIHCRSSVKIYHANNEGYVAEIGDCLAVKLGHFDWNPFKENHLEGMWQKFVEKGSDYQVWLRQ